MTKCATSFGTERPSAPSVYVRPATLAAVLVGLIGLMQRITLKRMGMAE